MNKTIDVSNVILKTDRLILRPWQLDDLNDFYEYAKVDGVGQMAGWLPHKNIDESRQILEIFIAQKKTFAIVYNNKVVGSLGIEKYDEKKSPELDQKMGREIGYVLSKDYWKRGLMSEAVKEVVRWLFEQEKLDFIICGHFVGNLRSWRVQEKCGFRHYKLTKFETRYGEIKDCWISLLERERYCLYNFNK